MTPTTRPSSTGVPGSTSTVRDESSVAQTKATPITVAVCDASASRRSNSAPSASAALRGRYRTIATATSGQPRHQRLPEYQGRSRTPSAAA
jgi:hypothetical protein